MLHTDGVIVLCSRQRRKKSPKGTPDGAKLFILRGVCFLSHTMKGLSIWGTLFRMAPILEPICITKALSH